MNNVKPVKSIGKRVQELRKERGWKQVDLAKRIGRPQGYVSRFEGDEFENPTKETIEMFAKALRIDPSELFANQSNLERPPGAKDAPRFESEKIPVIGLAKAGKEGFFTDAGFPVGEGFRKVDRPDFVTDPNAYALEIDGDSMSPALERGWTIVASPQKQVVNGDLVVARLQSGEVMLKKVKFQDGLVVLTSFNPSYEPIALKKKDLVLLHKVVLVYPK